MANEQPGPQMRHSQLFAMNAAYGKSKRARTMYPAL
jgi:hypothetical protein